MTEDRIIVQRVRHTSRRL
ncbi:hypothetical protein Q8W71_28835 [Methylobacterium sp. NEAU 140]|nr:hypothetical protein [Methylobacterium sp. NEAU 140]MDP4026619.1 hypothetical protein [Methylobacterium sp. NEAU 140]